MQNADVIVVGAGQAGCAAAYDLASVGKQVVMLDKPAVKPCAGGVTIKALNRLRFSIDSIVRERPLQLDMSLNQWRFLHWSLVQPMCVLVERKALDDLCLQQALAKGASYQPIKRLLHCWQDNKQVVIETDAGCYCAPWVIAADGAHSPMRRLLVGGEKASGAYAIEAKLARHQANRYPGMQFDFQAATGGYGWLFPKGDHINVGLYVSRLRDGLPGREALRSYAQTALGSDQLTDVMGYPLGTGMPRLHSSAGRVLFAGDAVGSCEPLLGEGIYGAIFTGQLAAKVIVDNQLDVANSYRKLCQWWLKEIRALRAVATGFYATTPLAYGLLHHVLRCPLCDGYANGLTPLRAIRHWGRT